MHWDLLQVKDQSYNGDKWVAHGICNLLGLHVALTGPFKSMIRDAIKKINALVKRKFHLEVKIIRREILIQGMERGSRRRWIYDRTVRRIY